MQKISIITITCRTNPRLADAGRTLVASLARCKDAKVNWIIVDELDRGLDEILGLRRSDGLADTLTSGRLVVSVFPPPKTEHRAGPDKAVAHNTARNAGLLAASGCDYVVFLNDCNVLTADWVSVAHDCSDRGVGWKCKTHSLPDIAVPVDGILRHKDHHDLLRVVPPTVVAGSCWGAPKASFDEIGGFDLAYDGQRHGNDVDAIIRLARTGLEFVTTERAFTLQLRRTKIDSEVTTRKDVYVGARNQTLVNQLLADKTRIHPLVPSDGFGLAPIAPPAAPPAKPPVLRRRAGASAVAPVAKAPRPPRRANNPAPRPPVVVTNGSHELTEIEDDLDDLADLTD